MATAKELRVWATTIRQWAVKIEDAGTADRATRLAAELDLLAAGKEVGDRQLV